MSPSNDIIAFREVLRTSRSVVILAGAGLSAASGIQTYRGSGGLWKSYDPTQLATFEAFRSNPGRVWMFYKDRIERCRNAIPNAAHRALASLALPSVQARLLPSLESRAIPPLLVTQNFDGLSVRALNDLEPDLDPDQMSTARTRLIEMHGSAFRTVCLQCKCTKSHSEPLSCPAFDDGYVVPENEDIPVEDLPKCGGREWAGSNRYGRCGGLLRPGVVWFGEAPEQQGEIARVFNWADVLLVVGTSAVVHPAAGYVKTVKNNGGKVAVFNIEASSQDEDADFVFLVSPYGSPVSIKTFKLPFLSWITIIMLEPDLLPYDPPPQSNTVRYLGVQYPTICMAVNNPSIMRAAKAKRTYPFMMLNFIPFTWSAHLSPRLSIQVMLYGQLGH
ncbi:unnamed protein product [Rhizoctonia solani]|uniref:Deacetylase sirtuin-type domain-containing protein n=1 Tax=Rhizoctonia solani TaxID=456999 RepID=A0A8H2X7L6_9AGAM|nr:unnamed protein product [Rhizoctonia solani]